MKDPAALSRMDTDEVKRRWVEAADTTVKFLWAVFERDPASTIPKDDVYSAYIRYCQENGVAARAKSVFSMDLNRLGDTRPHGPGGWRPEAILPWDQVEGCFLLLTFWSGWSGCFNLIACERKEVQSTDLIYTNKVVDTLTTLTRDNHPFVVFRSQERRSPGITATLRPFKEVHEMVTRAARAVNPPIFSSFVPGGPGKHPLLYDIWRENKRSE